MVLNEIDVDALVKISKEAGEAIMKIYEGEIEVQTKEDESPLTLADQKSNEIIEKGLLELYPDIPIISEESKQMDWSVRSSWTKCWLVDPLDGTKEFIKKNGEFTTNIALIENGEAVLGVVYVPAQKKTYYGIKGLGAFVIDADGVKTEINARNQAGSPLAVVASRSHPSEELEAFISNLSDKYGEVDIVSSGSSLKICMVAEGVADIYPRLGPTMEWDTGAGHAVVSAAGGSIVLHSTGEEMKYNRENLLNEWFLVLPSYGILESK